MKKEIKDGIMKELEDGVKAVFSSGKYTEYLDVMSRFYSYSANNCLLIAMQKPEATLVAGFKAWQTKFNRQVRKGEKAIRILAPCPHKVMKEINGEEKEVTFTTFRSAAVFDVSQTEGDELPDICERLTDKVEGYERLMDAIVKNSPVPVRYESISGTANGYYSHTNKEIVLDACMAEAQTVKTLVHEVAHAILHDKESGTENEADRRTKEVQAESVAYVVCNAFGIDTSAYSFEYVASWSKNHDVKELMNSLEVIRTTAKHLAEGIASVI